jgi:hypothetical protein
MGEDYICFFGLSSALVAFLGRGEGASRGEEVGGRKKEEQI